MNNGTGTCDLPVRLLDPGEYSLWDESVSTSPTGSLFHTSQWLKTISTLQGVECRIYGCWIEDDLAGGCPLFVRRMGMFTIGTSIPPMTPFGGILLASPDSVSCLSKERWKMTVSRSLIRKIGNDTVDSVHIVNTPGYTDIRPFLWEGWDPRVFYTYSLDPGNLRLSRNARRNLKKARENAIYVKPSENIADFCTLFTETFRRRGVSPAVNVEFLQGVFDTLSRSGQCRLMAAENASGEMIGGDLYLTFLQRACRWAAVTSPELRDSGGSFLLIQESIREFEERGYGQVNMMTANVPFLSEFTMNFGATLVPYYGAAYRSPRLRRISALKNIFSAL